MTTGLGLGYAAWREDRVGDAVTAYEAANARTNGERAQDLWAFVAEKFPAKEDFSVVSRHLYWGCAYPDFGQDRSNVGKNIFTYATATEAGLCVVKSYLKTLNVGKALDHRFLMNPKTGTSPPPHRGGGYGCGK